MSETIGLRRDLGIWGAAAIVAMIKNAGTTTGRGIFLVPTTMIKNVGSTRKRKAHV